LSISVFWIAFAAFVASGNSKETTPEDSQRQRHIRRKLENPQPQLRIIGGDNANEDRYPYYVALMRRGGSFVCGGTLVAPDVVLTAAHCWSNDLEVALIGKFERRGSNQDEVEEREIEETYIHPQFDFDRRRFDQMLITLTSPSTFPYLKHVNMDGRAPAVGGSDITTIGLGATNIGGSLPNVLQEGTSRYVPNTECSSFRQQESQLINFEHLCVDSQTNAGGACYGRSSLAVSNDISASK
jgi:secreted trypsin-like serine protease